jgi:single-strand DNA-binding protein
MLNHNQVELIGHIATNPEVRTLTDQKKVANFRMATTESWKNGDERKERTEWHPLVIWKPALIDFASTHVKKGAYVRVIAKLQHRKVEKDGEQPEYKTDIVVRRIDFLEPKAVSSSGEDDTE